MGSEGQGCYRCPDGMMMHRRFWNYTYNDQDELVSVVARPVTPEELQEEYQRLAERDLRHHFVVSPQVSTRLL